MPKKKSEFRVRQWRAEDIEALIDCYRKCYGGDFETLRQDDRRLFNMEFATFPEGQFLVEHNNQVVGYSCSIIVQLDDSQPYYKYTEITGDGTFSTHSPGGDTLYGADIAVIPEFRGQGVAGLLYVERMNLMRRYNMRRMVAHGRLPDYKRQAGTLTAREYVDRVVRGDLKDQALTAHLKTGYKVKSILLDHLNDRASLNYTTWLEFTNPDFNEAKRQISANPIGRPTRRVRVCAAQYEMKHLRDWNDFVSHVRFFVDSATTYHCHFLVFPELFTMNLFTTMDRTIEDLEAIKRLAELTPQYIAMMQDFARTSGIYIVGGSHPTLRDGAIYNTCYLFTPTGAYYTQDKLHITPRERETFGVSGGTQIRLFETPMGRMALVVCYDIEFPELVRILADHGAEIIFVPFSTDERKAYNRVRFTAHSRAIENCVYVVLAGSVGNLPNLRSYLLNYGQSAILTPSDFGFPIGSVEAEADANTETVAIADLDLSQLHVQREIGSVRPFFERRHDLYEVNVKIRIEIIRTY